MNTSLPKLFYNIHLYRITAIVAGILTVLSAVLVVNDPRADITKTIQKFYTSLVYMELTPAIQLTSGQLRQNYIQYRSDIENAVTMSGYSGDLRDIEINIVDFRETYAKATVKIVTDQQTRILSRTTAERYFDVELAYVDGEWRVISSIQRRFQIVTT